MQGKCSLSLDNGDDAPFIEILKSIPENVKDIDIILVTPGGSADTVDYMVSTDTATGEVSIDIIVGRPFPADEITISYDVDTDSVITDCSVADLPYILPTNAENLLITAQQTVTREC